MKRIVDERPFPLARIPSAEEVVDTERLSAWMTWQRPFPDAILLLLGGRQPAHQPAARPLGAGL